MAIITQSNINLSLIVQPLNFFFVKKFVCEIKKFTYFILAGHTDFFNVNKRKLWARKDAPEQEYLRSCDENKILKNATPPPPAIDMILKRVNDYVEIYDFPRSFFFFFTVYEDSN